MNGGWIIINVMIYNHI